MNAMETRIKDYEQVWLSNDNYQLTPDLLTKIKRSLANGNVVVTGSRGVSDFVLSNVTFAGNVGNNGDLAVVKTKKSSGGHQLAIVGYDDSITAKYKGVTLKGAFLAANSWGTGYGNGGYIWIMYDAISAQSQCGVPEYSYMGLYQNRVTENRPENCWSLERNSTVVVKGVSYPTYDMKDRETGKYLTYESNGNTVMMESQKSEQSEWCFIPYKTACQWTEFDESWYDSRFDDSYLLYEVNKDKSISEVGYRYLDAGISVERDGRTVHTASFSGGWYPYAKCWKFTIQ